MNEVLKKILSKKGEGEFDVAVMYSGGKDSAYLLYLMKEVYHLRVVAVMVDNGFEHDYAWEPMSNFAKKMGVPCKIICPDAQMFKDFFRMLIMEHENFQKPGINHVCFICNNILWCCVAKFAMESGIPYVVSGLSLAQLNSGRSVPLMPNELANAIAEKSTRIIYRNALEGMKQTKIYQGNEEFQSFIGKFSEAIASVTTVYPYIYHSISLSDQKALLKELDWQPPSLRSIDQYISSGCRIMKEAIRELEKLGMITINEREQAKSMVENGLMDKKFLEGTDLDVSKDPIDLTGNIFHELELTEYLAKLCQERGKEYIL